MQKDATTQPRGVECRIPGHLPGGVNADYSIVFTFVNNLVGTIGTDPGAASVITGPGSVVAAGTGIGPAQNQYTVNLTGVTNANYVTVGLHQVSDAAGNVGNEATTMGVLVGDTNADTFVNSADITQTKSQSGSAVTGSNFREDVNIDGLINSADITFVKSKSGTAVP